MSSDESLSGNAAPSTLSVFNPRSLTTLLWRPREYFSNRGILRDRRGILITAALIGISNAMDRIDQNLIKAELREKSGAAADTFTTWVASSWSNYWMVVLAAGAFSAVINWYLLGWWYRKRLEWSGAGEVARDEARSINVLQNLVYVLPVMAWAVVETSIYTNYAEAWAASDLLGVLLLVFLLWSCWTSYCAATTFFTLNKIKARFWFLILPVTFYLIVLGVFTTLLARLT
nr:hypothetical protein [uncultured Duganella sp.]